MQSTYTIADLDGTIGFTIHGGEQTGWGIAPAGDVNGDGIDDLIVSTFGTYAYVLYGGGDYGSLVDLASMTPAIGFAFDTAGTSNQWATSFDMNGDGISDAVLGNFVLFGSSSGLGNPLSFEGGGEVVGIDINGDGFGDLVVGQDGGQDPVSIYFGGSTPETAVVDFTITAPTNIGFAASIESAGDFNGDGITDLIIGAPHTEGHGFATGSAYVIFGNEGLNGTIDVSELNGTNGFRIDGAEVASRLGYTAGNAGDINGDGIDDIVINAVDADPTLEREGSTYIIYGRTGGMPPVLDLEDLGSGGVRIDGISLRGQAMATATGDFNGDGYADIAIGSPDRSPWGEETGPENAYVIFGRPDIPGTINVGMLDGSNGFTFAGGPGQSDLGRFVSFVDLNHDGYDDFVVSAPRTDDLEGAVYVIYGHDTASLSPLVDPTPHLIGTSSNDALIGTSSREIQEGLAGDDLFTGGPSTGGDQYRGGSGFDTITYAGSNVKVTTILRPTGDANADAAFNDTYVSIEGVIGTDYADLITGDRADNMLNGGGGDDMLNGFQRDDALFGKAGDDSLEGGEGIDYLVGGTGNDTLYGDDGNDHLVGGADSDTLFGGNGDDLLFGGEGTDYMVGGEGNDTYLMKRNDTVVVGEGHDTIVIQCQNAISDGTIIGFSNACAAFDFGGADAIYNAEANTWTIGGTMTIHSGDGNSLAPPV
jgi:hypothetical protein